MVRASDSLPEHHLSRLALHCNIATHTHLHLTIALSPAAHGVLLTVSTSTYAVTSSPFHRCSQPRRPTAPTATFIMIKLKLGANKDRVPTGDSSQNQNQAAPPQQNNAAPPATPSTTTSGGGFKLKLNVSQPPTPVEQTPQGGFPSTSEQSDKKKKAAEQDPLDAESAAEQLLQGAGATQHSCRVLGPTPCLIRMCSMRQFIHQCSLAFSRTRLLPIAIAAHVNLPDGPRINAELVCFQGCFALLICIRQYSLEASWSCANSCLVTKDLCSARYAQLMQLELAKAVSHIQH